VASPKSVRAARWLTSGDPRKSEISGKRRRFSATTAFRSANSFGLIRRQFRSTTPCSSPSEAGGRRTCLSATASRIDGPLG
jgi:hypothetical protein